MLGSGSLIARLVMRAADALRALPGLCIICDHPLNSTVSICPDCRVSLPWLHDACARCARPMVGDEARVLCGRCIIEPPPFDSCHAALVYQPPVDRLVKAFKFNADFASGRVLADCLATSLERSQTGRGFPRLGLGTAALLPVPLHTARQRSRGFNQSHEIARWLGSRFELPLMPRMLRRVRATAPQSGLSARARKTNLQGAFVVSSAPRSAPFRHVVLVDDVVTTGTTVGAVARVLKAAGVERVDVWAVARALEPGSAG